MDLDELLARFQNASAAATAAAPLISVDTYVQRTPVDPAGDRAAARRMLAAFAYWLATRERIAGDAPAARAEAFSHLRRHPEAAEAVIERLDDALYGADVDAGWRDFARAYLSPGPGRLGDDYFTRFVALAGRRDLGDAHPTAQDYAGFAADIDARAQRFREASIDWDRPLTPDEDPGPAPAQPQSEAEWLRAFDACRDLLASPPASRRARLAAYWRLLDASPQHASLAVASALCGSYRWIGDAGIQQAVDRALLHFPPPLVVQGILAHIVELEAGTGWASLLVDVFPDDLGADTLAQMAAILRSAPVAGQAAYMRALRTAEDAGSRHAGSLLRTLAG